MLAAYGRVVITQVGMVCQYRLQNKDKVLYALLTESLGCASWSILYIDIYKYRFIGIYKPINIGI